MQPPHRAGIGAAAAVHANLSLGVLSFRALSLSAPSAYSEKVPGGVEQSLVACAEKPSCDELVPEFHPSYNKDLMSIPLPAQVTGKRIFIGDDFLETISNDGFIMDKSLVCKVLLEDTNTVSCLCMPRLFGKSFNLSIIAEFFNPVTVHDCKGGGMNPDFGASRERRRQLFSKWLLGKHHPDFVEKYLGTLPVIQINFAGLSRTSLGAFYKSLTYALYNAATLWVKAYMDPELLKNDACVEYKALQDVYATMGTKVMTVSDSQWEDCSGHALVLFGRLSDFLAAQHGGKYIILVDDYDQPLVASLEKEWQAAGNGVYLSLLMGMFKNNRHLVSGVLIGVHEVDLSYLGSGLNIGTFISLTAGQYRLKPMLPTDPGKQRPHPLAELFAFTVQDVEALVTKMLDTPNCTDIYSHEEIMDEIMDRYGYDFGYATKWYNPWLVLNFLECISADVPIEDVIDYTREVSGPAVQGLKNL
ncbi:hypothetical protein H4R19_002304 [Coemansia spiralis]|nr:hypothetical protein H4R19_002304 [Coemansia spiralis]